MTHATMEKFGYPDTLIKDYAHWTVQLRPKQATLGALVLICKEDVTDFAAISSDAHAEMKLAVQDIERVLGQLFGYDKINYLMLMMVDPHVHFHVIPRYAESQEFASLTFTDPGWPGPPDIGFTNETNEEIEESLLKALRNVW